MDNLIEHKLIDGKIVSYRTVPVHRFSIYEDDPDIFAGEHLYNWEQSLEGQFLKSRAVDISWHRHLSYTSMRHEYVIVAKIEEKHLTEYYLKWGKHGSCTNW